MGSWRQGVGHRKGTPLCRQWLPSKADGMDRRKKSNFLVEKTDQHYLSQWSRSTSTTVSHADTTSPWSDAMRTALYLCGLPPPNPWLQFWSLEKCQMKPNRGVVYKIPDQSPSKRSTWDPAILLLDIYPKKAKTLIWKDIYTPMFIASTICNSQAMEKTKCPLMDEWIKKMCVCVCVCVCVYIYIYKMGYYSAMKKKGNWPFTTTWMELDGIILSEISQTERKIPHGLTCM